MAIFTALFPIFLALCIGIGLGKTLPKPLCIALIKTITPLVWVMLFFIGFEFGEVVFSASVMGAVLVKAGIFAFFTTLIPCGLLVFVLRNRMRKPLKKTQTSRLKSALPAIKEASVALSMVFFGALLFVLEKRFNWHFPLPNSTWLLWGLLGLVGIDLTRVTLDRTWFSRRILIVPVLVMLGSWLGALPAAWLCDENWTTALGLASGFNWFSLSSVMVAEQLGNTYGALALGIDLFRELFGLMVLYSMGRSYPSAGVGGAGAAAMDTMLPIIKQTCSPNAVPLALVSGFLLTLAAPVFIMIFLS